MINLLINNNIPPLHKTDTVSKALKWMDEFKISDLPLIDEHGKLIGNISESFLMDSNNLEISVSELKNPLDRTFLFDTQHYIDFVRIFSTSKLSVIPVIDKQEVFVGCISAGSLVKSLHELSIFKEQGSIISLKIFEKDYMLTQIANIIEGNEAKILGMYLLTNPDSQEIEVVLKINKNDLSGIIQTFDRYNYKISGTTSNHEYQDSLKNRFDEFMNYLNL